MVLNILYYDQANEANTDANNTMSLSFGPLYISTEQVSFVSYINLLSMTVDYLDWNWYHC